MNAIELIAALKGADEETAMELVDRLQCGEIDCSVLPTGKDNAVQQAQIWAQEARTQKGIVEEIGKLVGCANDWEMVDAIKAALSATGGEAVAWAAFDDNGDIRIWGREKPLSLTGVFPLYPGPAVKESLTVHGEPIGYVDPDCLTDYRAGDRLHMPVYRPDASADWQDGIPVYLHPAPPSVAVPELNGEPPVTILGVLSSYARPSLKENGVSDQQVDAWFQGLKKLLTAAPSPDHIADAGKVVPENEIKARALEEYADQLDVVFANAQEAGATDCPAWHAGQFAKDARKQAALLRTAGDEGDV